MGRLLERALETGTAVRVTLLLGALLATAICTQAETPSIAARRISGSITLDGKLDEPEWRDAPVIRLVQQAPRPGAETPFVTEVRVLVGSDAIYFGFLCRDPHPEAIAVHTMVRDGDLSGDDTVAIVLDTYGDRKTGYYFQINAAGARVDGLIDHPESASLDWDGIWDARTARTKEGWSAEIVIPSRTLSFERGRNEWGLNIERFIARGGRTWMRWSSPTLDSFLFDLSRAGVLKGVGELEQGKGIELTPYATGKATRFYAQDRGRRVRAVTSHGRSHLNWSPFLQSTPILLKPRWMRGRSTSRAFRYSFRRSALFFSKGQTSTHSG